MEEEEEERNGWRRKERMSPNSCFSARRRNARFPKTYALPPSSPRTECTEIWQKGGKDFDRRPDGPL